jgi:hypothetical protein
MVDQRPVERRFRVCRRTVPASVLTWPVQHPELNASVSVNGGRADDLRGIITSVE